MLPLLFATALADDVLWYTGNSGITSRSSTTLEAAMVAGGSPGLEVRSSWPTTLDGYVTVILVGSSSAFSVDQIADMEALLARGGTLVLVGDTSSFFTEAALNQLAYQLGLRTQFVDANLDSGCGHTASVADASHPFAAGMTDGPQYGASGSLLLGPRAMPVFTGDSGQTLLATEGLVVFAADLEFFSGSCTWNASGTRFASNLYGGLCAVGGDEDGDGADGAACGGDDCDDDDATIHPGTAELCDGEDGDCDGVVPEDEGDADGDGWLTCVDCDDGAATVGGPGTWYPDTDGDGEGVSQSPVVACDAPLGYAPTTTDCDDDDPERGLFAPEVCDGDDEDCDDRIDEADAVDAGTWHPDADGDGYGSTEGVRACTAPDGWSEDASDCDDADAAVHPGADEVCDEVDQDCDTLVDDDPVDGRTWYADADADGYGDPDVTLVACADAGASEGDDCDDADPDAWPGAPGWSADCERVDRQDPTPDPGACGCESSGPPGPAALLLALALRRRVRSR